jgi:hypothetical protein
MIPIIPLIFIFLTHLLGDWFLQTGWMATNKSKWWQNMEGFKALYYHAGLYSLCFLWLGEEFAFLTFVFHLVTDAITSQLTTRWFFFREDPLDGCDPPFQTSWTPLWANRSYFFNTIGVDQTIHFITLVLTYHYLKG